MELQQQSRRLRCNCNNADQGCQKWQPFSCDKKAHLSCVVKAILQGIGLDGGHENKQTLVAAKAQAERMRKQEVYAAPFTLSWVPAAIRT
jgi:hypothetical protein